MTLAVELDTDSLSTSSKRAYLADLADIRSWCASRQIPGIPALTALDAFVYLVEQRRLGRAHATLRRRRTLLRKLIAHGSVAISAGELGMVEDRFQKMGDDATTVLVVSDDAIIRAGLRAVLTDSRAGCWTEESERLSRPTADFWDYVLIWINYRHGLDPYGPLRHINSMGSTFTAQTPIVAVYTGRLTPMLQLRLAEAGVRYAVPHAWLSDHLHLLAEMLDTASVPIQFHLDTALAMRQRLGLSLSGTIDALLSAAAEVPAVVWTGHLPQTHLPISRTEVTRLRRIAGELAGVPGPDFSKYATSAKRAPETPEWPRVREVVRQALNLTD